MSAKHEKVEVLFNEALKLKPEERNAFLAGRIFDSPPNDKIYRVTEGQKPV